MELCKTCKFWEKPESDYGEIPGVGTCKNVPPFWDVTEWTENYNTRQLKPQYAGKLAFAQDGSERHYMATLMTMPDFGCVQHKSKEIE